jgi:hypothetical protein
MRLAPFASMRRQEIDAFFSGELQENPFLWNGRLLLLRNVQFAGRIIANLSAQPEPEFRRMVIVRDRSGIVDSMPPLVRGFLEHIWS